MSMCSGGAGLAHPRARRINPTMERIARSLHKGKKRPAWAVHADRPRPNPPQAESATPAGRRPGRTGLPAPSGVRPAPRLVSEELISGPFPGML